MQFKSVFASLLPIVVSTLVSAQASCPEAGRFGSLSVTPTTLAPGDTFTVTTDFTCSLSRGIIPAFVDYYLRVPVNNNGHQPSILLARHTFTAPPSGVVPLDTLTTQLPHGFYFNNSQYVVAMDLTYAIKGTDNSDVFVVGGLQNAITLTGI